MSLNISVVITTYNRPDCLLEALNGVKSQLYSPFEIIIIDDNSSQTYESAMPTINALGARYLRQNVSCGANKARNLGIEEASGEVIAFLDDDDIWLPEYLTTLVGHYEAGADGCEVDGVLVEEHTTEQECLDPYVDSDSTAEWIDTCDIGVFCKRDSGDCKPHGSQGFNHYSCYT